MLVQQSTGVFLRNTFASLTCDGKRHLWSHNFSTNAWLCVCVCQQQKTMRQPSRDDNDGDNGDSSHDDELIYHENRTWNESHEMQTCVNLLRTSSARQCRANIFPNALSSDVQTTTTAAELCMRQMLLVEISIWITSLTICDYEIARLAHRSRHFARLCIFQQPEHCLNRSRHENQINFQ